MIVVALKIADGRCPVIAGTGTNCTQSTIRKTKRAESLGVSGCMIVCPYYNKPSQEGIFHHIESISIAVPCMPLMTYNVPSRTGVDMKPETIARIAHKCPMVIAHKEASGIFTRYAELIKLLPLGFCLFTGEDAHTVEAISNGCVGVVSVVANAFPRVMSHLCHLASTPEGLCRAREINTEIQTLHEATFCEPSPAPIKYCLYELGKLSTNVLRSPLLPLTDEGAKKMSDALSIAMTLQTSHSFVQEISLAPVKSRRMDTASSIHTR